MPLIFSSLDGTLVAFGLIIDEGSAKYERKHEHIFGELQALDTHNPPPIEALNRLCEWEKRFAGDEPPTDRQKRLSTRG